MIAFITLFLGLVTDIKPIELAVSEDVAEVEVLLDGEVIGRLHEEPWVLDCDFGRELTTHELVAVARSASGFEIARVAQLVNVPGPQVESQIVLEDWQEGVPRSTRLLWQAVEDVDPLSVSVVLDDRVLADRYQERYALPDLDPQAIHFLSARIEFPGNISSAAEVVFGGTYGSSTETELTAIPLVIAGRKLRQVERLQGRLEDDGEPLRVFALEDGPAEVVMVRDRRAIPRLATLDSTYSLRRRSYPYASLAKGDTMLIMSPRAYLSIQPDTQFAVFPLSPPRTRKQGSVPGILASTKFTRSPVLPQRLTDAVATAGLRAASSQTRRVVVLVTADCADNPGQRSPEGVRQFLAQLRVPFRVWQVEPPAEGTQETGGFCDSAEPIHTVQLYHTAIKRLRRDLLAQQIVWVEGRHLQRKISLVGDEPGIRLAD